jgi:HAD superfamily hydrolase (TIGR01484 family)
VILTLEMQITALLSDYDGTLCPTSYVRNQTSTIPDRLEHVLRNISSKIPLCLVSSKDFSFLDSRAKFAKIISCIMGIETIEFTEDNNDENRIMFNDPRIYPNKDILRDNSDLLDSLARETAERFKEVIIERKYTSDNLLAGLTFDYRHIKDWEQYKQDIEPVLFKTINDRIKQSASPSTTVFCPYVQSYSSHPFIDVYSVKCDKGRAVDMIISLLGPLHYNDKDEQNIIMYLGDSENDNPAFRKAGVSIGVRSDPRLNPRLESDYIISFDKLGSFLESLLNNDMVFSSDMILG